MPNDAQIPPTDYEISRNAFLIIDGVQIVLLDKPVTTIGRKKDNHIIINNPHVSRQHAQIRHIQQRYHFVDLNSKVGCSVNGERITQAILQPGDVISIGGVPLIFGQGIDSKKLIQENMRHLPRPNTGPTETTDLKAADQYLDWFEDKRKK